LREAAFAARATVELGGTIMVGQKTGVRRSEWHHEDRPRVLVENADGAIASATENLLLSEGYDIATCSGPRGRRARCPLVTEGECAQAQEADVILYSLRINDPDCLDVLRTLRLAVPDTPVVVEIPQPQIAAYAADLVGCHILPLPYTRDSVRAAIGAALSDADPDES
jgi:DNA-binding NtrC family response regulator